MNAAKVAVAGDFPGHQAQGGTAFLVFMGIMGVLFFVHICLIAELVHRLFDLKKQ
jgi:hypothetical protein